MRSWVALAAVLAVPSVAISQQPESEVAEPSGSAEQQAFNDMGLRMTVPVSVGASGPYAFLVDTGAERTVISRELAGTLKLAAGPNVHVTAIASGGVVGTAVLPSIAMGRVAHRTIEAPSFASADIGAAGMLGLDVLKGRAIDIDFDRQIISVRRSGRVPSPGDGQDIVVRARSRFGQLVVTDASIAGKRVRVVLDTGSSLTIGNPALRRLVGQTEAGQVMMRDVNGAALAASYVLVDRVTVGGIQFGNVPIAFADAQPFRRFKLENEPALFLGMDAMRLFRRVSIDFGTREVRFVLPRAQAKRQDGL